MAAKTDRLSLIFSALSDPTRRGILAMLAEGEKTVSELVESFDLSQPAISKHLKVLEQAGLVARGREAQRRPAILQAQPLKKAFEWVEPYDQYWQESLGRESEHSVAIQPDEKVGQPEVDERLNKRQAQGQSDWQMF
ncbi:MAG: metalloregulator ArsR/SmtB family transcription factor [Anaerolineales bacterium]|jgi:DNA-binding transcriptional ArsR family regulator